VSRHFEWSPSFRFPYQNPVYTCSLPHTCCMPCLVWLMQSANLVQKFHPFGVSCLSKEAIIWHCM
jgi:hypothetical protein